VRVDENQRVFFSTVDSASKVIGEIEPGVMYSNPKFVDVGLLANIRVASDDHRKQARIVLNHFW
jgi:hypothetical protein